MNPDPRVRRGAHRTSRAATATLLPSLLAILAVTSLITALYVWRGEDAKPPSAAASNGSRSPKLDPTTTPPATTTGATATAATEPVTTTSSPAATHKAKTDPAGALRASVGLVVLNETARSGLAATVATRLRAKGWTVSAVGNFRGAVPATTVYYPVGKEAAANAAAKSLPTPPRVLPRFGNLSETRLTVIVTTNYPS
jgi:LytR cell envelope-related transcriptional attenuator